ncbi:uncharacterized protein PWA37_005454 [Arxiozyma heterogenica]|uniref:Uncharacterized protein n=1 Tax=Arxiozyma heterogenica TaxID=278026 RepID=A0AAN7WUD5_9SACH|nr:hypothetical protein RI543_000380 [Kazachstania heterogenica]
MPEDGLTEIFSRNSTRHVFSETSIISRKVSENMRDSSSTTIKNDKVVNAIEYNVDAESASVEFTQITDLGECKSIWHKIYYNYIVLDKTTLNIKIKESFFL